MGKHLPRNIRIKRERERLDELAASLGFENTDKMLYELYVVQRTPLKELQAKLFTPMYTLRRRLEEICVPMRSRGGRNNVKSEITPELIDEVSRDGVTAVAMRLGIDGPALGARLKKWFEKEQTKSPSES